MTSMQPIPPGFSRPRSTFRGAALRTAVDQPPVMAAERKATMEHRLARAAERMRPQLDRLSRALARYRGKPPLELFESAAAAPAITPEQRLVQRTTLGMSLTEMARIEELGYSGYLDEQLASTGPDVELEELLVSFLPTLGMSAAEVIEAYGEMPEVPVFELLIATVLRAAYSRRQLFERAAVFWSDHFSIDLLSDFGIYFKPVDDRDVVRRYALTSFPQLLSASAHSPAMLAYLTNDSNVKEHPNENYARELMELHTLGADNGYTQQDVVEVARCFTGWRYVPPLARDFGELAGQFIFFAPTHDFGAKTVLGTAIPAGGGVSDGETVLALLAGHPNTATFVAGKLLNYFYGYNPTPGMVDLVAEKYADTGGDVRDMLRSILRRKWMQRAAPKLKRPFHLMIATARALFADANPFYILESANAAGHLPFTWEPPNGFPDSLGYWSGYLLPRWNFGAQAFAGEDRGGGLALVPELEAFLDPALKPGILTRRIDWLLTNNTLPTVARNQVRKYLAAQPRTPQRVREALGLALASPYFQDY